MFGISAIKTTLRKLLYTPEEACRKNGMKIGKNCSIGTWTIYPEAYLIEIGDHVQITSGVHIFTHGGGWTMRLKYPNYDSFGKVVIGNNVYIGNNALLMPGITVGDNVVIGAGAVVTKNVPSNVVIAGNPARIVKSFDEYIEKNLQYNLDCKQMSDDAKKIFLMEAYNSKRDCFIACSEWLNNKER